MVNLFRIDIEGSFSAGSKHRQISLARKFRPPKIRITTHRCLCLSSGQRKSRAHHSDASVRFLKLGGRNPSHRGRKAQSRAAAAHENFTSSRAYTDNE